ncbi:MAG: CopG family transcriptional regulator [Gammaproteobacteria bacterium]|nr:CopG family transcriptional regulator [Gammaproteobacteria bacterium]
MNAAQDLATGGDCITIQYMATITLRVPDDVDRALQKQSEAAGISKSDLVREAVRRYLAVGEFRALRARLVPQAQAQGIHTDDDVFRKLERP